MNEPKPMNSIHPGEILREEFMVPLNISGYRLAKETGMSQTRISEILKERRRITADTAIRLSRFFGTTPQLWLNLQNSYELEEIKRNKGQELATIIELKREV